MINDDDKTLHSLSNKILAIQGKVLRLKKANCLEEVAEEVKKLEVLSRDMAEDLKKLKKMIISGKR